MGPQPATPHDLFVFRAVSSFQQATSGSRRPGLETRCEYGKTSSSGG